MPKFPENPSPAMYKSSGFKMKNSALYKSAKHGSPMQQNYDNTLPEVNVSPRTTPNKKDFVSTHVNKGITVPKKTTLENLTRKQNQVPSEGGRGNTTTTTTTKKFKTEGRDKVKEQQGTKRMHEQFHQQEKVKQQKSKNRVVNTLNTLSPKNIYNTVVPKPFRDLNKGIVNLFKK